MQITVDATELPRKLLHSKIELNLTGDSTSLLYPKWIPGIHGPKGSIQNLGGFSITDAQGTTIRWERDWSDVYRHFVYSPSGAGSCDISLTYICNQPSTNSKGVDSYGYPSLGVINWNTIAVYPEGIATGDITITASLILPPGWQFGTALPFDRRQGDTIIFEPVSF